MVVRGVTFSGSMGSEAGAISVKKFSTGVLMSIGICACGIGTRVGSGSALTSVSEGGGGGEISGGGSSKGGGGGGGSNVAISTSRIVRSVVAGSLVYRRALPRTTRIIAEAAMPMMVDLKFKL